MKTLTLLLIAFLPVGATAEIMSASPIPTRNISLSANLDAGASGRSLATITGATTFTALRNPAISDAEFSIDIIDALGGRHELFFFLSKRSDTFLPAGQSEWVLRAFLDESDLSGGIAGQAVQLGGNGVIRFNDNGSPFFPTDGTPVIENALPSNFTRFSNGSQTLPINITLQSTTSYDSPFVLSAASQDGQSANCSVSTAPLVHNLEQISELIRTISTPRNRIARRQAQRKVDRARRILATAMTYSFQAGRNLCTISSRDVRADALSDIDERLQNFRQSFQRRERLSLLQLIREELAELRLVE